MVVLYHYVVVSTGGETYYVCMDLCFHEFHVELITCKFEVLSGRRVVNNYNISINYVLYLLHIM